MESKQQRNKNNSVELYALKSAKYVTIVFRKWYLSLYCVCVCVYVRLGI